ncbi:hypothetical protein [Draconibacterium mangrovi]|uniref:hypothetical protein n=1 Tax=Draconibacterium mangrovi TaxID=2697469 RepID=UPI0013D215E9|nr:hypothetical protein [Draconibacterium mangrovi]
MKEVIEKYHTNTVLRADAYEWLLLQFEEGSLTSEEEADILKSLSYLEMIKKGTDKLPKELHQEFYFNILSQMEDGSFPPDLIFWSAVYYNLTRIGIDTSEMREVINYSPFLSEEIEDNILQ